MIIGTDISPIFWMKKVAEYAEPSTLASITLGMLGQRAAGTSEKEIPRSTMAPMAIPKESLSVVKGKRAKIPWQTIIKMDPRISIVAPLPFLSR